MWAELQRLSLQMDLLLTKARQSQVTFQGVGPSQVSGEELGRQSSDHRAMSELASGPDRTGYTEPQFPLRYGSEIPWNGHQYVAGGQMDADFGQATGLAEDRHLSGCSGSSHSHGCRHSDIHSHGCQIW